MDNARAGAREAATQWEVLPEIVDGEQRAHAATASPGGEVARHNVARCLLFERRRNPPADIARQGAAAREHASGDALLEARHHARYLGELCLGADKRGAELGHRREQALRIGMARGAEQVRDVRLLDLAA